LLGLPQTPGDVAQVNTHWEGQFARFDLVKRTELHQKSVIRVLDVEIGGPDFVVMAGPCSVENERQTIETAEAVRAAGATILRGGAFKPRSSPYSFQGLGLEGLKILAKARRITGLAIVTEAMSETEIGMVAEYADIVQIGSRNMENTSLLMAVARCGRPILLKRGLTARIEDLLQAAELVMENGNPDVILCERGIRTFETATRNTLDIQAVPVLHAVTHLPVIVDPSHASGVRELVPLLARVALAADAEGLIVEVHPDPARAWCDGEQSLTFAMFREMMADLAPYRALRAQKQESAMAHAAEQG
jgi:3-deoxy-7-phosphoheptulonate synthase